MTAEAFCAVVDWGTSRIRVWLMSRDGVVLAQSQGDEGMLHCRRTGFAPALEKHLTIAGADKNLRLWSAGWRPQGEPGARRRISMRRRRFRGCPRARCEALLALRAGASALKFFPASVLGPAGLAAIGAILPPGTVAGAVGGVTEAAFANYAAVGVSTSGLATSLDRPGDVARAVRRRARAIVASYDREFPQAVNRRATVQTMVEPGPPKDS